MIFKYGILIGLINLIQCMDRLDHSREKELQETHINPLPGTVYFPALSDDKIEEDGSWKMDWYKVVPFLAAVYATANDQVVCAAFIFSQDIVLTSEECARRALYYADTFYIRLNYSNPAYSCTYADCHREVLNAYYEPNSKISLKSNLCVLVMNYPTDVRIVPWPYPDPNKDFRNLHTHCVMYGYDKNAIKYSRAIAGRVLSLYQCRSFGFLVFDDEFCLYVRGNKTGPCDFLIGGPVQCGTEVYGIVTYANKPACTDPYRIFLITRIDKHYDLITRAANVPRLTRVITTTTDESRLVEDAIKDEPVVYIYVLLQQIREWFLWLYYTVMGIQYRKPHDIIWNILPVIFKIVGFLGIICFFRTKYGPKRPKKFKFKKRPKIQKSKRIEREKIIIDEDGISTLAPGQEEEGYIYYDPETGKYYYPESAIQEVIPAKRRILSESPVLKLDKRTKLYANAEGVLFQKFNHPEEFKQARQEVIGQNLKLKGKITPIYLNKNNGKYYYPASAVTEVDEVVRSVVKKGKNFPLVFNEDAKDYTHPTTGEKYLEFDNPNDFETVHKLATEQSREQQNESYSQLTPIYLDPETHKLFYPKTAIEEETDVPRTIVKTKPPLFFDPKRNAFYDVRLGEKYIRFNTPVEFDEMRLKQKSVPPEETVSPIYHDVKAGNFYYPKAALLDDKERDLVETKRALEFDSGKNTYVAPGSKEEYILMKSESEFRLRKAEILEESTSMDMYYDDVKGLYYYPEAALESATDPIFTIIQGTTTLKYDPNQNCYLDPKNTKYLEFKNQNEYTIARRNAQTESEKLKAPTKAKETPIYFDPTSKKYYFPECTMREVDRIQRDIIEGRVPLLYDPNNDVFVHPESKETYWEFNTIDEFLAAWEQSRQKVLEEQLVLVAAKTPIFYDKGKKEYYYPERALMEEIVVDRKIRKVSTVPLEQKGDMYFHVDSGETYIRVEDSKTFEVMRDEALTAVERTKSVKDDEEEVVTSPIYFDPNLNKYFYPESAITEKEELFHEVETTPNPLKYDEEVRRWVHPETGEHYLDFNTQDEFFEMRLTALAEIKENEELTKKLISEKTPIYLSDGKYYYPEMAIVEPEEIPRKVITEEFPLVFDPDGQIWVNPDSQERYIEFGNQSEFQQTRDEFFHKEVPENRVLEVSPIYEGTDGLYYPKAALEETEDSGRSIVKKDLEWKEMDGFWVLPDSEELYVKVSNKEEFLNLKHPKEEEEDQDLTLEDEVIAKKTPIYQVHDKYYYPQRSITESKPLTRETIQTKSPLKPNPDGTWIDPKTKEIYIELNSPEEFSNLKENQGEEATIIAKQKEIASKTPILYDLETDRFFYPKMAFTEIQKNHRELIEQPKLTLSYDPTTNEYQNEDHEIYIPVKDLEEFEKLREDGLRSQGIEQEVVIEPLEDTDEMIESEGLVTREVNDLAILTPIYHDPKTDDYYYPVIATIEERKLGRQTIEGHLPDFEFAQDIYKDPITGELYIKVESPEEFDRRRNQSPKLTFEEILKDRAKKTPIYHDDTGFYYPERALFEAGEVEREVIEGSEGLIQDKDAYWSKTEEKYFKVETVEEFQKLRNQKQERMETDFFQKKAFRTPIYEDGGKVYYPECALEEDPLLIRPTIKGTIPLHFADPKFYDPVTGEVYLQFDDHAQFAEQRVEKEEKLGAILEEGTAVRTEKRLSIPEEVLRGERQKYVCVCPKPEKTETRSSAQDLTQPRELEDSGRQATFEDGPSAFGKPITPSSEEVPPTSEVVEPPRERTIAVYETFSTEDLTTLPIVNNNLAVETPLYYDPQNVSYYYPCVELYEKTRCPRKIIETLPDFKYEEGTDTYLDPVTGWKYVRVFEPTQFDKLRTDSPKLEIAEMLAEKAEQTSIILDPKTNKYYYPMAAIYEINELNRVVDCRDPPEDLVSENGLKYVELSTPSEFQVLRTKYFESTQREISKTSPIYFDPDLQQYFYPVESAIEQAPTVRDLLQRKSPLKYYENQYFDPYTKEPYFAVKSKLSFLEIRDKVQRGEPLPPQTPPVKKEAKVVVVESTIGMNEVSPYWESEITEEDLAKINVDNIPDDGEGEFEYEEVEMDQEDYPEEAKALALETPVYLDPDTGLYYYPSVACQEKIRAPRKVIRTQPPLSYDPRTDEDRTTHMDPKTGWRYMQLEDPSEFERIASQSIKLTYAQIRTDKSDETPLYHDPTTDLIYYPYCAIYEVEERPRVIISGEPPLKFDSVSGTFRNNAGDHYIQCVDSGDFEDLRAPVVKKHEGQKKQWAQTKKSPIYYNVDRKEYYYPVLAATEQVRLSRPIIKRTFPLDYNYEERIYVDPCYKQKYMIVEEPYRFEVLRSMILRGKKPPRQRPPVPIRTKNKIKHLKFGKSKDFLMAVDTPVYFSPSKQKYYYPELATHEKDLIPRKIIEDITPLVFDFYRSQYIDTITGEKYIEIDSFEQFEKIREKSSKSHLTEIELDHAHHTPIYFDPNSDEYFYPDLCLFEVEDFPREIVTKFTLTFDPITGRYRTENGEPYQKYKSIEEFENVRNDRVSRRLDRRNQGSDEDLPIYEDPLTERLFYPFVAFEEVEERPREIIRRKPPLFYDRETFSYMDEQSGEQYMEVISEEEFFGIRNELMRFEASKPTRERETRTAEIKIPEWKGNKTLDQIKRQWDSKDLMEAKVVKQCEDLAVQTPIYLDPSTGIYFYPEIAVLEHVPTPRKIENMKPPLKFDYYRERFYDPVTNETYLQFKNPDAFTRERRKSSKLTVTELKQRVAETTPIFYDTNDYFYPEEALYEINELPRTLVTTETPPLTFDQSASAFIDQTTGQKYQKFNSYKDFKKFRMEVQEKRLEYQKAQIVSSTPIYFDGKEYWYPRVAFEEVSPIRRSVVEGTPPVSEPYINVESPKDFRQIKMYVKERLRNWEKEFQARESPIYFETTEEKYYYPVNAMLDDGTIPREFLKLPIIPLEFDIPSQLYFDKVTNEKYCKVDSPEEFEQARTLATKQNDMEEKKQKLEETPIFFDAETKNYYYPEVALEEPEYYPRKILNETPQMYSNDLEKFFDIPTGEPYFKSENPLDFQQRRVAKLKELNLPTSVNPIYNPVYYDTEAKLFYYPKQALEETSINPRRLLLTKPNLSYDYNTRYYYEITSGEAYIQTFTPMEFKQLRLQTQSKLKPFQSLIYMDIETNKYYYPVSALRELVETQRELVIGKPPIRFNPEFQMYFHPETREEYLIFESPSDFRKSRNECDKDVPIEVFETPPIYQDSEKGKFYYPRIGLDKDLNQENIVEGKPSCMMFSATTKVYYDALKGDQFLLIDELEDIGKIRENIRIRQNSTEIGPVYRNRLTGKYYYPIAATLEDLEKLDKPIDIISTPLKYNAKSDSHYDPLSGREYVMVNEPKDFELFKIKRLAEQLRLDAHTKMVLKCTPNYMDPTTGLYFYPKRSLKETETYPRITIFKRPFLYCDVEGVLYEPSTGEEYFTVNEPTDVDLILKEVEEERDQPDRMAIFYDKETKEYLYPESALTESVQVPRKLVIEKDWPLYYSTETESYHHKVTHEKYLEFKSPTEFTAKRKKISVRSQNRYGDGALPIYYEDDTALWYYPKEALLEIEGRPRVVLTGRPLLRYDPNTKGLYDPWTGKEYQVFNNLVEFEKKRHKMQKELQKSHILPDVSKYEDLRTRTISKNTPIYYDPHSKLYYYPREALEEAYPRFREVINRKPVLYPDRRRKHYIEAVTQEPYVSIKTEEQFWKLREQYKGKISFRGSVTQIQDDVNFDSEKPTITVDVFYDTVTKKYFYPKTAVIDPNNLKFNFIRTPKPSVKYDCESKYFFELSTKKQYYCFNNPVEFERVRTRLRQTTEAPVYKDPETGLYYYPQSAFHSTKIGKVLTKKPPLKYDQLTLTYYNSANQIYIECKCPEDFRKLSENAKLAKIIPIYYDPKHFCFYYPQIRYTVPELDKPYEVICTEKDPLFLDPKTQMYFNIENGFYYQTVGNEEEETVPKGRFTKWVEKFQKVEKRKFLFKLDSNTGLYYHVKGVGEIQVKDYSCGAKHDEIVFYYNPEEGLYYHPFPGYSDDEHLRIVQVGKTNFQYIEQYSKYYNPETGLFYYTSDKPFGEVITPEIQSFAVPKKRAKPPAIEYYGNTKHPEETEEFLELEQLQQTDIIPETNFSNYRLATSPPLDPPQRLLPKNYPFYYDPDTKLFYNIQDGLYYETNPKSEIPIYYDAGVYYYPRSVIASPLKETTEIIKSKPPFYGDPNLNLYFDSDKQEQYFRVTDPSELDDLDLSVKQSSEPPLYYDPNLKLYFYPFKTLQNEDQKTPPNVMVMPLKLKFDMLSKTYFDPGTKEQYFAVREPPRKEGSRSGMGDERMVRFSERMTPATTGIAARKRLLRKEEIDPIGPKEISIAKLKPESLPSLTNFHKAPIVPNTDKLSVYYVTNQKTNLNLSHPGYYDPKYDVYYYPSWVTNDFGSWPIVQNPPTFMYDVLDDLYIHPDTGETYNMIQNQVVLPEEQLYNVYYVDEVAGSGDTKSRRDEEVTVKKRSKRKRNQDRMVNDDLKRKMEQATDNLPWGVELEEYYIPVVKSRRIQQQSYYHVKSQVDTIPRFLVRQVPIYSNPYNLINDTLFPYSLVTSSTITASLFDRKRK